MKYNSTEDCLLDLERHGHLLRIREEVDPNLEMAAIHLRVFENKGPAILFENVKGSKFRACSNLFGTLERSKFMFRDTIDSVSRLIHFKNDPVKALKDPIGHLSLPFTALKALPSKKWLKSPSMYGECKISDLPQIKCWENDGGAFITLPLVYTEDVEKPGVMNSNLGMYRIQLGGNDYIQDSEIGLHYQIHRGIGVHHWKANRKGVPLKVSIFVGGPPAHILSAVMPLPEGLSELTFAGVLAGQRFSYTNENGYVISSDADFVITGEVYPGEVKPEGPFGDHLGYYSLVHDFPVMKVDKVYHRKDAIWSFTVVGRPPQEDTSFGQLIHEITGPIVPSMIPGLHDVHAVDAAGVHPLLLAIGSERYTPFYNERKPQELLTIANHILGFGQMSLAKYLLIVAKEDNEKLDIHHIDKFFMHMLERVDWRRDLHFHTNTSIDTLDYSGTGLNTGSKLVIAAAGEIERSLSTEIPKNLIFPSLVNDAKVVIPGILALGIYQYQDEEKAASEIKELCVFLELNHVELKNQFPLIVICDDASFVAKSFNNFLWVTFTRSNPSHDIHGVGEFTKHKHWGCAGSLVIDVRVKPHHAPPLIKNLEIEKRVDALGAKGKSLHGII